MRKAYLFVYSSNLGTKEQIKECLNQIPQVIHWRTEILHSFYLISESSASELVSLIRECRGNKGRFLITEISESNRQGVLPKDSWYLIKEKKRKEKSNS